MVTVIFAAYAVGVSASLYLIGHLSDSFGRRRVIVVALLIELLSAFMFLLWNDTAGLIRGARGLGHRDAICAIAPRPPRTSGSCAASRGRVARHRGRRCGLARHRADSRSDR